MDVKVFLMIIYFCWQGHPTSLESLPWSNYCILLWVRGDFTFGLTVQFLTLSSMTKILFHRSCGNSGSYMWRLKKKIRCPGGNYRKWLSPYKQCGFSRQKIIIRHQKNRKLSRGPMVFWLVRFLMVKNPWGSVKVVQAHYNDTGLLIL